MRKLRIFRLLFASFVFVVANHASAQICGPVYETASWTGDATLAYRSGPITNNLIGRGNLIPMNDAAKELYGDGKALVSIRATTGDEGEFLRGRVTIRQRDRRGVTRGEIKSLTVESEEDANDRFNAFVAVAIEAEMVGFDRPVRFILSGEAFSINPSNLFNNDWAGKLNFGAVVVNTPGFDFDGDGVINADDNCPATPANSVVNEKGCSIEEFCVLIKVDSRQGRRRCNRADFMGDELRRNPRDCMVNDGLCVPRP